MVSFLSASTLLQQRIRRHFEVLMQNKRWQNMEALMHFSSDIFFDRIYAELVFLAQKKRIQQINLIDLVFLSDERSIISTYITRHSVPFIQATIGAATSSESNGKRSGNSIKRLTT